MGKVLPAFLLLLGALAFIISFIHGHLPYGLYDTSIILYAILCFAFVVWSYFFGNQRGHPFHFLQVVVYAAFGTTAALYSYRMITFSDASISMLVFFAPLVFGAVRNYKQINEDFRSGIKRDFFQNEKP